MLILYKVLFYFYVSSFIKSNSYGQRFSNRKSCKANESCTPIRSCPQMLKLIQSGNRDDRRKVDNSVCRYSARTPFVCCPKPVTRTVSTTPPPNRKNLLPKVCGRPSSDDKITGGAPAPIGAYPWMAAIGYSQLGVSKTSFECAGSIINSRYVLTAAHCVDPRDIGRRQISVIHLGDWNLETKIDCETTPFGEKCYPPHIESGFDKIIVHPEYDPSKTRSNDIGLIRLNAQLDFKNDPTLIEPICLPSTGLDIRSRGDDSIGAGWGMTEDNPSSNILLRVKVPFADESLCQKRFPLDFVGKQLCLGGKKGMDTCVGDSGGPLIISRNFGPPFTQIGIVSFGPDPCGIKNFPGVYTSVKDYVDWIKATIQP